MGKWERGKQENRKACAFGAARALKRWRRERKIEHGTPNIERTAIRSAAAGAPSPRTQPRSCAGRFMVPMHAKKVERGLPMNPTECFRLKDSPSPRPSPGGSATCQGRGRIIRRRSAATSDCVGSWRRCMIGESLTLPRTDGAFSF